MMSSSVAGNCMGAGGREGWVRWREKRMGAGSAVLDGSLVVGVGKVWRMVADQIRSNLGMSLPFVCCDC